MKEENHLCFSRETQQFSLYLSPTLPQLRHQTPWDFYSNWSFKEWWSGDMWHLTGDIWQVTYFFILICLYVLESVLLCAHEKRISVSLIQDSLFYRFLVNRVKSHWAHTFHKYGNIFGMILCVLHILHIKVLKC